MSATLTTLRNNALFELKNLIGWRTKRRIVVFCVDDYGNVRLASRRARANLDRAGLEVRSRFDALDTLETRADLEYLYETLSSVKDSRGRAAVFTPYALPCNIDFEKMAAEDYRRYHYELLPQTYAKLAADDPTAYAGAWSLWQEGMRAGLLAPQFHGREHLNVKVLEEKLARKDPEVRTALRNRSYTSLSSSGYDTISYTAAYAFWRYAENEAFAPILTDGLDAFERVYGYRARCFTPPAYEAHPVLYPVLAQGGIRYLEGPLLIRQHEGEGKYRRGLGYTGKTNESGQTHIVRNVVFEPTDDRGVDWVAYALRQIEAAFRWNRPAIISSHRVNFCGHIDEQNRKSGLDALHTLLRRIVVRWPDTEFRTAGELGDLIPPSVP